MKPYILHPDIVGTGGTRNLADNIHNNMKYGGCINNNTINVCISVKFTHLKQISSKSERKGQDI